MVQKAPSIREWYELTSMMYRYLGFSKLDVYTTRTVELEKYLGDFVKQKKDEERARKKGMKNGA